jgi:hypothetical protein
MKKMYSLLILCLPLLAGASTSITTSVVSGHWTMAGSPYKIYNDITINLSTSLTIDAGVDVQFMGYYHMNVYGSLFAVGTASSPISFHRDDTTGWFSGPVTAGGWKGITFGNPSAPVPTPDSSSFSFCDIYDLKESAVNVTTGRNLVINNCDFFHNAASNGSLGAQIDTGHYLEIGSCRFYDNVGQLMNISNFYGGSSYFHDNDIFHNHSNGNNIVYFLRPKLLFERNKIHDDTVGGTAAQTVFQVNDGTATIKANMFYNNLTRNIAPLYCNGGNIDINGNLVCNNQNVTGSCGATDGGGGIHVSTNGSADATHTYYTIRNNVIANNYTPFVGGAIKVFWANVNITNNQIINNSAAAGCGGIELTCDTFSAFIKNNIFYNNIIGSGLGINSNVWVDLAKNVTYEHNWSQNIFSQDVFAMPGSCILLGDTTTDIIGGAPGLVNPTLMADVTESALPPHDFSLLATSSCINTGDTAGVPVDTFDCGHHPRIYGSAIDIGAYEFAPALAAYTVAAQGNAISVFPNPAGNIVFISTPAARGQLRLLDASGKTVATHPVTGTRSYFDIHDLSRGLYFVTWADSNGALETQKLIVE